MDIDGRPNYGVPPKTSLQRYNQKKNKKSFEIKAAITLKQSELLAFPKKALIKLNNTFLIKNGNILQLLVLKLIC